MAVSFSSFFKFFLCLTSSCEKTFRGNVGNFGILGTWEELSIYANVQVSWTTLHSMNFLETWPQMLSKVFPKSATDTKNFLNSKNISSLKHNSMRLHCSCIPASYSFMQFFILIGTVGPEQTRKTWVFCNHILAFLRLTSFKRAWLVIVFIGRYFNSFELFCHKTSSCSQTCSGRKDTRCRDMSREGSWGLPSRDMSRHLVSFLKLHVWRHEIVLWPFEALRRRSERHLRKPRNPTRVAHYKSWGIVSMEPRPKWPQGTPTPSRDEVAHHWWWRSPL